MDWGLGAFQKAELVFMEVLNTPLLKLEHRDRVKVASASFWRHCGLKYNPNYQFLSLLNNNEILSSKQVGSALRLAESLTSMSSLLLDEFKIYKRNKTIFLKIPNNHSDIVSKQVTKRLKNLAREMNVDSNIIYS
jgi:exopolyphosphatase/guanosine-5'-triphosphate,3'-diphosphate pyrophosphatase